MSPEETAAVSAFLDSRSTLTLATQGPEGPWAATVFYAHDAQLNLYFVSSRTTRHVRDLLSSPNVAATVSADVDNWESIRGLQIAAQCRQVAAERRDDVAGLYLSKFPDVRRLLEEPASASENKIAKGFAAGEFFCLQPRFVRFVDNSLGFGHKLEFPLGA